MLPNPTRREFLKAAAAATAVAACPKFVAAAPDRLPIGFSTLGCPTWEWLQILDFAAAHGFAAVELRGLQGNMDLPTSPQFSAERLPQSKRDVASRGLKIACVSSSANLHDADPAKHEKQLAAARRFIDLASALGAPYVRVFGNKIEGPREPVIERVAAGLRDLGAYAAPKNVTVIMESHGDFTDSATLRQILENADSPHVGLLWDAHHTYAASHEDPEYTVSRLGKYIRHTHLKDSVPDGKDRKYVLTGHGDVPVRKQVEQLTRIGYKGYYSFEWEKVWHPDIEEPEVAFAEYADVMRQYLQEAKSKRAGTRS